MNNQMNNQGNNQDSQSNSSVLQSIGSQTVSNVQNGVSNSNSMNPSMRVQSGMAGNVGAAKQLPKKALENPKYTENWLNLKTIKDGIIYTKEGLMVTGIRIEPKNIFILESYQADSIILGLMNFYNTIDYEFWLMAIDRPVDISVYEAEMQILYNKTTNPRLRKVIAQDMNKGDSFVNNNVVDIEYYLLFKEKKRDVLQKRLRDLINGIASCGLNASPVTNEDARVILDNLLNGGKTYDAGSVMF